MKKSAWRQFAQSDIFRSFKLKLRHLTGIEPRFKLDINIPIRKTPGWCIPAELVSENDIVYTLGVCNDIEFELMIINDYKAQVYAFDPTPFSIEWIESQSLPENFNFYPCAISGKDKNLYLYPRITVHGETTTTMYTVHKQEEQRNDGITVEGLTLKSITRKLNHNHIDVLKIDIEGAEYEVLQNMLDTNLRPKIILIEFHHRFKGLHKSQTVDAISSLRNDGYLIAHISVTGREFCFVHKSALNY